MLKFFRKHSSAVLLVSVLTLFLLHGHLAEHAGRDDALILALLGTLVAGTAEVAPSGMLAFIAGRIQLFPFPY
jgi:hypothetical protein